MNNKCKNKKDKSELLVLQAFMVEMSFPEFKMK